MHIYSAVQYNESLIQHHGGGGEHSCSVYSKAQKSKEHYAL